jgi:aminoglycoside 6-adenylyltransferase
MISKGELKPAYLAGYRILLDKDGWSAQLPLAPGAAYELSFPNEQQFREAIDEFWFEAYHVAKYLHRSDWWVAQVREGAMKKWMLRMLQWSAMASKGKPIHPGPDGKRLLSWIREDDYRRLKNCSLGWEARLAGPALQNCLSLFRDASSKTGGSLGFPLEEHRIDEMEEFIRRLMENVG